MMDLRTLSARTDQQRGFASSIGDLVATVGSDRFEPVLFEAARAATQCEHLTAFAFTDQGPTLVLAANAEVAPIARAAGNAYVAHHWRSDPGNRACLSGDVDAGMLLRASGDEIRNAPFRQRCYSAVEWAKAGNQMLDRLSVIKRQRDSVIKISFHRAEWAGLFSDGEIENVAEVADLLTALVARHHSQFSIAQPVRDERCYMEAARLVCPQLTEREAEICARIVLGLTSEGMALDLDLSINTVRTYRKRAYGRLKISSQNELMKLILPHVSMH